VFVKVQVDVSKGTIILVDYDKLCEVTGNRRAR
jgi:hypothetical protein